MERVSSRFTHTCKCLGIHIWIAVALFLGILFVNFGNPQQLFGFTQDTNDGDEDAQRTCTFEGFNDSASEIEKNPEVQKFIMCVGFLE